MALVTATQNVILPEIYFRILNQMYGVCTGWWEVTGCVWDTLEHSMLNIVQVVTVNVFHFLECFVVVHGCVLSVTSEHCAGGDGHMYLG